MDQITNYLVAFGHRLTDHTTFVSADDKDRGNPLMPAMDMTELRDLLWALSPDQDALDSAYATATEVVTSQPISYYLSTVNADIVTMYGEQARYVPYVYAAKNFFLACQSYEVGVNKSSKLEGSFGIAVGFEMFHVGGGYNGSRNQSGGYDTRFKIPLIFVVLIDLCDVVIRRLAPTHVIGIPESIELFNKGLLSKEEFNGYVRYAGGVPDVFADLAVARSEKVQWREIIEYARRTDKDDAWIRAALLDRGIGESKQRAMMNELYWEVPSIQDHLHWLQRNVFDEEYVEKYDLMRGFEERFWKKFGDDLTVKGVRKHYAALHYAAHWIQPSPTQMQEFIYRLRPGKVGRDNAFTLDDYRRILTEQDYAPLARDWFVNTAYRVPALGYIRDMYRQGVITDDDLVGYHQDLGYTRDDSDRFLGVDRVYKNRFRADQSAGWTASTIGRAVALGLLQRNQAVAKMDALGFTAEETDDSITVANVKLQSSIMVRARSRIVTSTVLSVRQAIDVGVMDVNQGAAALMQLGWPQNQAIGIAQLEANTSNTKRVKHIITQLRGAFHRGEIDVAYAKQAMSTVGIVNTMVSTYITQWQLENTPYRKRRTATQIVNDIVEHGLSLAEATARLQRLGYHDEDVRLFIADANQKLLKGGNALLAASEIRGMGAVQELVSLEKTSGGLNKRIVGELQKQLPPLRIQKWLSLGIMKKDEAARYLALYGWEPRAIDLWIEEGLKGVKETATKTTNGQAAK